MFFTNVGKKVPNVSLRVECQQLTNINTKRSNYLRHLAVIYTQPKYLMKYFFS